MYIYPTLDFESIWLILGEIMPKREFYCYLAFMYPKIHLRVIVLTIYIDLALKYGCEWRLRLFSLPDLWKSSQNLYNKLAFCCNYVQNVGLVDKTGPKFFVHAKVWVLVLSSLLCFLEYTKITFEFSWTENGLKIYHLNTHENRFYFDMYSVFIFLSIRHGFGEFLCCMAYKENIKIGTTKGKTTQIDP